MRKNKKEVLVYENTHKLEKVCKNSKICVKNVYLMHRFEEEKRGMRGEGGGSSRFILGLHAAIKKMCRKCVPTSKT
jgi:hypothetical protein